ncbi:hypothetical protein C1H46_000232 [Malus baccata]|uniref:Uncharacterized protein n=1 Tax=Malus baccata TaxID=106549 RepID=A0A540NUQ8_MALBA|nr:hypothetical protein C1H46_000232 [Malus baccata]
MVESREEDTPGLRTQVHVEAMGYETRNRVLGYGHRVTPKTVSYASSSAASSSKKSSRPMSYMQQTSFLMPVYRAQLPSPSDSHMSPGVSNGGLSPSVPMGLFSELLSGSFDGDMMRYFGAQGGSAKGYGHREDHQKDLEHIQAWILLNNLLVFLTDIYDTLPTTGFFFVYFMYHGRFKRHYYRLIYIFECILCLL